MLTIDSNEILNVKVDLLQLKYDSEALSDILLSLHVSEFSNSVWLGKYFTDIYYGRSDRNKSRYIFLSLFKQCSRIQTMITAAV